MVSGCIYLFKNTVKMVQYYYTLKMLKLKHWVKNVIEKIHPMSGFVHVLPKIGLKQTSIFFRV